MSEFAGQKEADETVQKVEKVEEGEDDGDDEGPAPVRSKIIVKSD